MSNTVVTRMRWSQTDDDILMKRVQSSTDKEQTYKDLATELNRTLNAIRSRHWELTVGRKNKPASMVRPPVSGLTAGQSLLRSIEHLVTNTSEITLSGHELHIKF